MHVLVCDHQILFTGKCWNGWYESYFPGGHAMTRWETDLLSVERMELNVQPCIEVPQGHRHDQVAPLEKAPTRAHCQQSELAALHRY